MKVPMRKSGAVRPTTCAQCGAKLVACMPHKSERGAWLTRCKKGHDLTLRPIGDAYAGPMNVTLKGQS